MKNFSRVILASLIIFVVSTVVAVGCYFALHLSQEFHFKNITKIFTQVGILSGVVTTVIYLLITICLRNIEDKGFRAFMVIVLMVFFLGFVCLMILNMVFYQLDNPNPFVKYLIEL